MKLTKGDLQTFHLLGATLARYFPPLGMPKAAEALSLTLYFVELYLQENYSADELVDISTEGQKKRKGMRF